MTGTSEYVFPTSFAQSSFWFLHQLHPDSSFYNVPVVVRLRGPLNAAILEQAFEVILERHETLRTVFRVESGSPVQIVGDCVHPESRMQTIDLSSLPFVEADRRANKLIAEEIAAPFDLSRGPVIRIRLISLAPDDHRLIIVIHHIVADLPSCDVLIRELLTLYGEIRRGNPPNLAPLELQYGDFSVWQRDFLRGGELERRMTYWRDKLRSPIPQLKLPYDRARPALQTINGGSLKVKVPDGISAAFIELCRQKHVTLFTAALATYAILLNRITGQTDLLIGTPASSRSMPKLEALIGLFLNTIVLRVEVNPSGRLDALLNDVSQTVLGAFDNEVPFQKLVEELRPERDPSRSPFFQTMLTVQHTSAEPVILPDIEISTVAEVTWATAKFDLTVAVLEANGSLTFGAEYNTDLFKRETIQAMLDQFVTLLDLVARQPECSVGALNPIPSALAQSYNESVGELVQRLQLLGLHLSVDGGKLKVSARKGVIDEVIKSTIAERRTELVEVLSAAEGEANANDIWPRRQRLRTPPLPLTSAQRRFWFIDRVGQGQSSNNVAVALRVEGPADLYAMTQALERIVERHEILRMRIGERDDEPYPEIAPMSKGPVRIVDLTEVPETRREVEGLRLSQEQCMAKFDLVHGPLFGMLIVRLAPNIHFVTISMHHIVSDGWSLSIVVREFGAHYSAVVSGQDPDIAPLTLQYVDFAAWESAQDRVNMFRRQLAYWKGKLAGAPALLELPTDSSRPLVQSFRGGRLDRIIDSKLLDQIKEFSQRHRATLFMTLLAAWQVLLHRYSGQDDIVIGTPMANRDKPELESVVGLFVNSLALRANLAGNPTFTEFLAQVKQATIDAFDNRDIPFDVVVEGVNPARRVDHSPIFQCMFALHNFPFEEPHIGGLNSSFIKLETGAARFDLTLDMVVYQGALRASFEYATDLFYQPTIERMHDNLVRLLSEIVIDGTRPIQELPLLNSADERLLVHTWNNTAIDHDQDHCVHTLFEQAARRAPDIPAVAAGEVTLTYQQIDERANRLAHLLLRRGVTPGSLVGICLDRGVDVPIAMTAVLKAGAAYVPLDPTHPSERLSYTLNDAKISCVVTVRRFRELMPDTDAPLVLLDEIQAELADLDITAPVVTVHPDDLAYVIYTSGSTGRPKGVQVEHRNVVNFLEAMRREPGFTAADVLLAVTTPSFDIAGLEIWLPLSVGGKVVIASRDDVLDGARLIKLLEEHKITFMQATPATWRLLVGAGWTGKPDLKALCGGEALPRDLGALLCGRVGELWNMYGPTETTIWSTASRVTDPSSGILIGRPIANTRVYVVEPAGLLAPVGSFGELFIGGEGVARGYWNRPDLTAEKFVTITLPDGRVERVYRTGDVVRFQADGQLQFVGRRDSQIKLWGYRIELGEIEAILATHPGVKECVVNIPVDEPGDPRLVGYVVCSEESSFDSDLARATLRRKLPAYMIPSHFVELPFLPLTPNGKINRKALPLPEEEIEPAADVSTDLVMNPIQRRVAEIWRQILRIKRVGLHDNFFDVGGQSMLVVRLRSALQREFGSDLTLIELFQQTTVAAQADRVASIAKSDAALQRGQALARKQTHG